MSAEARPDGRLRGLGVALVETPRFARSLERFGERLLSRVFTPDEVAYARGRGSASHSLAARFAAKCAGRSLLAPLVRHCVALGDLEVVRRPSGEPALVPRGRTARTLAPKSLRLSLSIAHDPHLAMASVWLEEG